MTDDEHPLLTLASRRRIYRRIEEAPGLHFRALQRDLKMPLGTLEYNLYQLEKQGFVVTREDAGTKTYYAKDSLDRRDRDVLHYLRQRTNRQVALLIADRPGIRFKELLAALGIFPSSLSRILKRLIAAGLVLEGFEGRQKTYTCADAERVRRLVIQYRATFVDAMVDRFADAWETL
jgi:predicted transcriptional regulator